MADEAPPKTVGINAALTADMQIMIQIVQNGKILGWVTLTKESALDYAGKIETLANLIPHNPSPPTRKLQS